MNLKQRADPVEAAIRQHAATLIGGVVDVLRTADALYGRVTVTLPHGEVVMLDEYANRLAAFVADQNRKAGA
jgi:predicted alpha/beta-fold hydrolase